MLLKTDRHHSFFIPSFVRRERHFTRAQQRGLKQHWGQYGLATEQFSHLDRYFSDSSRLRLEIGFGNGEVLLTLAEQNPAIGYLGVEVYRPGIGRLLNRLAERHVKNVRVICADITHCITQSPHRELFEQVLILFPDPWPKKRHHKRRLITSAFCSQLALWLQPGAHLHLATDCSSYAQQMALSLQHCAAWEKPQLSTEPQQHRFYQETAFERRSRRAQSLISKLDCYKTKTAA